MTSEPINIAYHHQPFLTHTGKSLTDHAQQTGDEAEMDADGYLKITGRIKDIIIRGGENIHPLEIENCLLAHPRVAEVSVVGLPDERYGEVVAAFVIPVKGRELRAEEVRTWVAEKLSHHLGKSFCRSCRACFPPVGCETLWIAMVANRTQCRSMSSGWTTILRRPAARSRSSS